jgi:transcription initiation factor TFIIE subunit alpha
MMSMDKDEATRRKERHAEAEAKRQQNLLPAWHLKSTISGHLTALGVAENARTEVNGVSGIGSTSSSNDDVLRGLGTVGSKATEKVVPRIVEDVRPVVNQESDCELFLGIARSHWFNSLLSRTDYDQYYASLAASATTSVLDTPGASLSDDFGDIAEDDEDRKPPIEYLDSLNDYRKRSRSWEDEGAAGKKIPKTGDNFGNVDKPSAAEVAMAVKKVPADALQGDLENDPIVHGSLLPQLKSVIENDCPIFSTVNGAKVPFSKVTEEDQDLMTPDEYTAYFEVYQTRL